MQSLLSALYFLVNLAFDFYILLLLLRLLFQKAGARWTNSISQFVIRVTEPVIRPFRRFVPGFKGFDLSIVAIALILEMVEQWLLGALQFRMFLSVIGVLVLSLGSIGFKIVNIYMYSIIINAIISWFPLLQNGPLAEIVSLLTRPILAPIRRFLPLLSGIDLSPLVAIVLLYLANQLVFNNIIGYGRALGVS